MHADPKGSTAMSRRLTIPAADTRLYALDAPGGTPALPGSARRSARMSPAESADTRRSSTRPPTPRSRTSSRSSLSSVRQSSTEDEMSTDYGWPIAGWKAKFEEVAIHKGDDDDPRVPGAAFIAGNWPGRRLFGREFYRACQFRNPGLDVSLRRRPSRRLSGAAEPRWRRRFVKDSRR